jgi:hypothetical protein
MKTGSISERKRLSTETPQRDLISRFDKYWLLLAFFVIVWLLPARELASSKVLAQEIDSSEIQTPPPIKTLSRFHSKFITQKEVIPKKTDLHQDADKEIGDDTVLEEGKDGLITRVIEITIGQR